MYCQEVTPGAFSMKRRPLVTRKLACWERERHSCNPCPPEQDPGPEAPSPLPAHPQHWLAESRTPISTPTLPRAGPQAPPLPSPLPGAARLTHQDHGHGVVQHHRLHREPLVVQRGDRAGQGHVQAPSAETGDPGLRGRPRYPSSHCASLRPAVPSCPPVPAMGPLESGLCCLQSRPRAGTGRGASTGSECSPDAKGKNPQRGLPGGASAGAGSFPVLPLTGAGGRKAGQHPHLMLSITGVSRTRKSRCCWGFWGPFFTSPRGEGGGEKGGNRSPGSKTMCSSSCQGQGEESEGDERLLSEATLPR